MTPDDIQRERQAFEVAMVEAGYHQPDRSPFSNGQYKYERDQDRFVGWQLARAVQSPVAQAGRSSCALLTEQDIDDIIAEGSYRNAAGGIYATSVYAFAREVAIEAVNRAIPRANAAAQPCQTCDGRGMIGGFVNAESGYQSDPSPDCTAQPSAPACLDVSFSGGTQPTHYCNVCGAMWRKWADGSWNLRSKQCGKCCDNEPMGDQIAEMEADPVGTPEAEPARAEVHSKAMRTRFLAEEDFASLFTFALQCEDSDANGYTADKEVMRRLAELGVIQSKGFGRYSPTAFGDWLVETEFDQNPLLPLRTVSEHNEREKVGHALYLKQSAPHSKPWVELPREERESWRNRAAPTPKVPL